MPTVAFTSHLRQHAPPHPVPVEADTVGAALRAVFRQHPRLESYVLDDQKQLRRHVVVFVDAERATLDQKVGPGAEIMVFQALSGG